MEDLSPELTARIQSLEGSFAGKPERYFVALAGAWREAGEIGRAEEILRENLKRFPGLSAHVLLGRCLADRGAWQEAANEFHYVLSIDAQNLIALRTLAEMAAAGGRRAEAEKWYNELLAVDPMNAEACSALQALARGGADASVAGQPASGPLAVAGGADADDAEFGMIDLSAPDASAADASGVAADDSADEWGDLPFDIPSTSGSAPAAASGPTGDFDGFGFVDLDAQPAAAETDDTGAVGAWLDADARQAAGEDRGALAPVGAADGLLDAPTAGTDLPFLDADDTGPAELPLLDAGPAGAPAFPSFDGPPQDDGFPAFPAPSSEPPAFPSFDADADDGEPADHPVDAEVVTETMAELYAAQGLLQQSADTYRQLIRQRGEEPGLVRRLAEIEARLHPAAAEAAAPAQEEAPDWLASVDAFAMGGAAAGLAAVHMSAAEDPTGTSGDAPETPVVEAVEEPEYATESVIADLPAEAAADDDLYAGLPLEAAAEDDLYEPTFAAPSADFAPPPSIEAATPADRYADSFADSFAGGFDGGEAATPEPAFAAAPSGSADADREPWQAPSVSETEPVAFDLVVVEEDGDLVAAPPEVVADVSADWAIAAAPLEEDEEDAEEARATAAAPGWSMRAYFSSLLAWTPSQSAAPATTPEPLAEATPSFEAAPSAEPIAADEPWADAAPSAEPIAADEPWAETSPEPIAAADEPWAESLAVDTLVYDDAPAAEAPPAERAVAEDEPWATPTEGAAPQAAEGDIPLFDLDAEPWSEAPRATEPPSIDSFELSEEIASPAAAEPEEALPWELPAEPSAAAAPEPVADAGGFSFEDFFAGGAAAPAETPAAPEPEPEPAPLPEPEPELPSSFVPSLAFEPVAPSAPVTPPPAAPSAPAASAPAAGQDDEDEDLESFQAWLQSLKR